MNRITAVSQFTFAKSIVRAAVLCAAIASLSASMATAADPVLSWVPLADYQDDFQALTPAAGWTYAWNPTGKLGNSSAFVKLKWSNVIQGYNTTGGALTVPVNGTTHNDDYLSLYADGGHPGNPNYTAIVGYTIQPEDGTGPYRLTNTSISKADGVLSPQENGLGLMVYMNNTLLGLGKSVPTNGQIINFDKDLGERNVGDTVWVVVTPLINQYYDWFNHFDFTIQKLTTPTQAVPEPSTAALVLLALAGSLGIRRRR